jgi:hypothetical protein
MPSGVGCRSRLGPAKCQRLDDHHRRHHEHAVWQHHHHADHRLHDHQHRRQCRQRPAAALAPAGSMDGFLRRYRRQHLLASSKFGANFSICTYGRIFETLTLGFADSGCCGRILQNRAVLIVRNRVALIARASRSYSGPIQHSEGWCGPADSNLQPDRYERPILTIQAVRGREGTRPGPDIHGGRVQLGWHKSKLIWHPRGSGARDTIQTCGLRLRRATLYPAELRVLAAYAVLTQISRMS